MCFRRLSHDMELSDSVKLLALRNPGLFDDLGGHGTALRQVLTRDSDVNHLAAVTRSLAPSAARTTTTTTKWVAVCCFRHSGWLTCLRCLCSTRRPARSRAKSASLIRPRRKNPVLRKS